MIKALRMLAGACLVLMTLSACSEQPAIDSKSIESSIQVEPVVAAVGEEVLIRGEVSGVELSQSSDVVFVVQENGETTVLDAGFEGDGVFTAVYTFSQTGTYDIDLHVSLEDDHISKKTQVEVK